MKALTVWQPWASLIAIGAKPYEFRGWKPPRSIIGRRIAIHAGARAMRKSELEDLILRLSQSGLATPGLKPEALPWLRKVLRGSTIKGDDMFGLPDDAIALPLSAVVCTVLVGEPKRGDLCAAEFGEDVGNDSDREGTFNWGWPMIDVDPLMPPVPARGAQGLWEVTL